MSTEAVLKTYESTQLNRVLEDSLHPGGLELTRRMAEVAGIEQTFHILDVGCGRGKSILYHTKKYGCRGSGVDLSPISIAVAQERSAAEGMSEATQFTVAGACQLPYDDDEFDAVLCECTLSLVNDKSRALREMARVVKPGGRVVVSDVVLKHILTDSFKQEIGFTCCFTEALTLDGYQECASNAGLIPFFTEDHSITLMQTAFRVSKGYGSLEEFWTQFGQGKIPCCNPGSTNGGSGVGWRTLFKEGKPGYWLLAWEKPKL